MQFSANSTPGGTWGSAAINGSGGMIAETGGELVMTSLELSTLVPLDGPASKFASSTKFASVNVCP